MGKLFSQLSESELIVNSSIVFFSSFGANLVVFFTHLYFSKILGPETFGIFKTILYLFTFLPVLIDLGATITIPKYIAEFSVKNKKKVGYLIKWFLKLRIFTYFILLMLIFIFREQIAFYFLNDVSLSYLIFPSMLIVAFSFFTIFRNIVHGFQDFKLFSISGFLIQASSAFFALMLSPFGIFYMLVGWGFGNLAGNFLNMRFMISRKVFKGEERFDIKKIFFGFSLPMYFLHIPGSLVNIIIPILNLFFPPVLIGYFAFSFMFYSATLLIPGALSFVLLPKVSEFNGLKEYGKARGILKRAFGLYTPIVLVGMAGVILLSDWLIGFIAGEYLPGLLIFKTLVCLGLIFGYNSIYVAYLQGLAKVKRTALFVLLQNILLFVASFILLKMM